MTKPIPDAPSVDEAKELVLELLPVCPEHKCVLERKGTTNERTGKSCFYTACPQCLKENRGTVDMEFHGEVPAEMVDLNIIIDDNGAHIVENWPQE